MSGLIDLNKIYTSTIHLSNVFGILEQLQNKPATNDKIDLLKTHSNNEDLKAFFFFALDQSINFYIKAPLNPQSSGTLNSVFVEDLLKFCSRKVTGNEAKSFLDQLLSSLTPEAQESLIRMINKNPKCGVNEATVNKVWRGLVYIFGIMKGDSIDDMDPSTAVGRIAEAKIDGKRCLVMKDGSDVTFLSSNGKPVYNLQDAIPEILSIPHDWCVLDCEFYDTDWNASQSISSSSKNEKTSDTWKLQVFDIITRQDWNKTPGTQPSVSFEDRRNQIQRWSIQGIFNKRLTPVHSYGTIQSVDHFNELCFQTIEEGNEGLMLKIPNYLWVPKRTLDWIKYKPTETLDYLIIDILPGDTGKKHENVLGRMILESSDGTQFQCGSGFSDEQRKLYWEQKSVLINTFCEVKQDRVPDKKKMAARFPRFIKLRPDKSTF